MASDDMLSWLRSTIEGDRVAAEKLVSRANARQGAWSFDNMQVRDEAGHLVVKHTWPDEGEHIALHDPRDTIARCEAELDILDQVLPEVRRISVRLAEEFGGIWPGGMLTSSEKMLLTTLAKGYRHRPGFRPEWVEA